MTRFWISLQDGVALVFKGFARMHGGEIFVPKIPSARMTDLASAMAPTLPQKVIGIRPGETLHEIMCPADNGHQTLEFHDYFVICPAITFNVQSDYRLNAIGETGSPVAESFECSSGTNPDLLSLSRLRDFEAVVAE